MTRLECKDMVLDMIKRLDVCIPNSVETKWSVRCPYCGDSRNPTHGHLTIAIDRHTDDAMWYRCLKCNEAGTLTSQVLEDLGLHITASEAQAINALNRPNGKNAYFKSKPKNYQVPQIIVMADVQRKLDYLHKRLGIEFTEELIQRCRIVLSIVDFINVNKIKFEGLSPDLILALEDHYVGFLSANNNKVVFRCIEDNPGKLLRYFKWTIDPFNTSPNNFYAPSNPTVSLLYTDPIYVHIAEGTFDIISIMLNMEHDPSQTHLFYGSCGYNFDTILKYLTYMGVNTDVIVKFYSDADKTDRENLKILNNARNQIWIDHAEIHRNQFPGEKDFGVPADRIKDGFIVIR